MDDFFIPTLSLLIITGVFIIAFSFSIFFKASTLTSDKEGKIEFVVAYMIDNLREICPVGARKGWTLIPTGYGLPRSWKKRYVLPVLKADILLHGSSVIVKSSASVIKDLISKPFYWDEWDSSYFYSSMSQLEKDSSNLKRDTFLKCTLISKDKNSFSQDKTSMFCFKNHSSDKVRWILFWNVMYLDWWFFLIQPAMRKQDLNHSLLTIIRGADSTSHESKLAKAVWMRIQNIKDAAEMHSFKIFPFTRFLENTSLSSSNLSNTVNHSPSCKKRSHTEACSGEVLTEEKLFSKNSSDALLQIVSSTECKTITSVGSRKFNILLSEDNSTVGIQEDENSHSSFQDETTCSQIKERSSTVTLSKTGSSGADSEQLLKADNCQIQTENMREVRNRSPVFLQRVSHTDSERSKSPVGRCESNISRSKSRSVDFQDAFDRRRECDPRLNTKRKPSFVERIRKVSEILSPSSSLKSNGDNYKYAFVETESSSEVHDQKLGISSDANVTERAVIKNKADTVTAAFLDSEAGDKPHSAFTVNTSGCETITVNESSSSLSNDKSESCKGNCFPMCDVCLKVAFVDLSDYEVLLPSLDISEERIADLLTKGNYCAAELQTEVYEVSQVKNSTNAEKKNSAGKWTHVCSNKDIDLYSKSREERSLKIVSYLCQTSLPVSPERVWNIIRNPRFRFICDETAKKVTVLEDLPEEQKIIYTYHEYGGILKKEAMDFCLLHSERVESSKYSIAYLSIEYENCPLSCALRGMLLPSGWMIEKLQGNSDECKVSYLTQVVVNRPDSLLVQESSNIVLQSIQNLLNYCVSAPESIRSSSRSGK